MPLDIELPILEHKYIKLYDTQDEYEADKVNYEEVCYSIVKSAEATDDNYSEYQYSIRTTNNDNEVMGKYWDMETPDIYAGLEIIWGYFGWNITTITLLDEKLEGGNFYDTNKKMSIVKSIPDGDRLQHIDYFLYYMNSNTNFKGYTVEKFNTENIKSARNFSYGVTNYKLYTKDSGIKLKQLEWNALLRVNMSNIVLDNILQMPVVKLAAFSFLDSGKIYGQINAPLIEYLTCNYNFYNTITDDIVITPDISKTNLYYVRIIFNFYAISKIENENKINIIINIPKSNNTLYYECNVDFDNFIIENDWPYSMYSDANYCIKFNTISSVILGKINTITINNLNSYYSGCISIINMIKLIEDAPINLIVNLDDSAKFYKDAICNLSLNNVPINHLKSTDGCYYLYVDCIINADFDFDLNIDGEENTNSVCDYYKSIISNVVFNGVFNLKNLDKVKSISIYNCTITTPIIWNFRFSEEYYVNIDLDNITGITDIYDDFHINIQNGNIPNFDNSYSNSNAYATIFSNCGIKWENHPNSYINVVPYFSESKYEISFMIRVASTCAGTNNINIYINKNKLNIYSLYGFNTKNKSISLNPVYISNLFNIQGNNITKLDLSSIDFYNVFEYNDEDGISHNWLTENNITLIVSSYLYKYLPTLILEPTIITFICGNVFAMFEYIDITEATNLDLNSFINSVLSINLDRIVVKCNSLNITENQYSKISTDNTDKLLKYFSSINIVKNET